MKTILSILAGAMLAFTTSAQFAAGGLVPTVTAALVTNSVALAGGSVYTLVGGGTAPGPSTNIVAAHAASVPIGREGFGITCNFSGTNATTTTNATFVFQFSGDGINWATNNTLSVVLTPLGATYAPCYTNIANTVLNVGNAQYIRLQSVHHTNTGSIFITNLNISTR